MHASRRIESRRRLTRTSLAQRFTSEAPRISRDRPSNEAALLFRERMLEEETQHLPCCVRSSRIGIGARGAASGPSVSGSVDIPVLQHSASARVAQDRSGIAMPSGYLPAMHLLLRGHRPQRLLKNLTAIVGMHGGVLIA